jgi:FkbM family methyltransferase
MTFANFGRRTAKGILRSVGLSVTRYNPRATVANKFKPDEQDRFSWLRNAGIRTVLDVGANIGQFAAQIRAVIPSAQIYSFEPLSECYRQLSSNLLGPSFEALPIALGAENGRTIMNRNAFSPSSSILTLGAAHKESFPFAIDTQAESVEVRRLDDVAGELDLRDNLLIKIDVQGFEDQVIKGGEFTIRRARVLIVEVSFEALYENQPVFDDIYRALQHLGFGFRGAASQLLDPSDGRVLQADGIFVKS